MNTFEIHELAEDALNAAVALIQQELGQTDGGVAAFGFSGHREVIIKAILSDYIRAEIERG